MVVVVLAYIAGRTQSASRMLPALPYIEPDERFDRRADLDLNDVPFAQFVDRLDMAYGVKLAIDWPNMAMAGITAQTPMTLQGKRLSLEHAIESEGTPGAVTVTERGGALVITTAENADRDSITRSYDLNHLHWAIYGLALSSPDFDDAGDGGISTVTPLVSNRKVPEAPNHEFVDFISCSIRAGVAPRTWKDEGGQIGSMSELNGILRVTHLPRVHLKIARYLEWLATRKPGDDNLVPNAFTGFDP
jgi:hypothetical protein